MNRIRFTRNRQNVCFLGGIILAGDRARPAVPGSQASINWDGLVGSELFTVDASSLALTSMDSSSEYITRQIGSLNIEYG